MGVELLTERYRNQIADILSCYDRIIIQGTLPKWCYASGMTSYFYERQIKIFDYPKWAQPLRDAIRENTERWPERMRSRSSSFGVGVRRASAKRSASKEILNQRGEEPGLVCILSAMEPCSTYQPWYDKKEKRACLKPDGVE